MVPTFGDEQTCKQQLFALDSIKNVTPDTWEPFKAVKSALLHMLVWCRWGKKAGTQYHHSWKDLRLKPTLSGLSAGSQLLRAGRGKPHSDVRVEFWAL